MSASASKRRGSKRDDDEDSDDDGSVLCGQPLFSAGKEYVLIGDDNGVIRVYEWAAAKVCCDL